MSFIPPLADRTTGQLTLTWFDRQWAYLTKVINGAVQFGSPSAPSNISGSWYQGVTPSSPDMDFTVPHNLGRTPTGFLLFSIDKAAIVYKGDASWTESSITLKCNTASCNVVLLVV